MPKQHDTTPCQKKLRTTPKRTRVEPGGATEATVNVLLCSVPHSRTPGRPDLTTAVYVQPTGTSQYIQNSKASPCHVLAETLLTNRTTHYQQMPGKRQKPEPVICYHYWYPARKPRFNCMSSSYVFPGCLSLISAVAWIRRCRLPNSTQVSTLSSIVCRCSPGINFRADLLQFEGAHNVHENGKLWEYRSDTSTDTLLGVCFFFLVEKNQVPYSTKRNHYIVYPGTY